MKKKTTILTRLNALFLALLLAAGLVLLSACDASASHSDMPQDVERDDGKEPVVSTDPEPAEGTDIFIPDDPDADMTYGQFLNVLVHAFYPDELARVGEDSTEYAPAIQVAVNRQLNFNTQDELMSMAEVSINRYNAAWFLVRILEDKNVVLPSEQERAAAAAAITDWDTLLEDEYWRYFVSSIYALDIITGADETGAFCGTDYIDQASAAAIFTRMADKLKTADASQAFQITFEGDWSAAPEGYQEALREEFYAVYPRLWARFGTAETTKHISLQLVSQEEAAKIDGLSLPGYTNPGYDNTKHQTTADIKICDLYVDDWRHTAAIFAHELTHAATGVAISKVEQNTWLLECLADYGIFRYAAWTDERYMWLQESYHQSDEEALRTWPYEAYTDTHWFFAYMDSKYPTTNTGYGLLDSILLNMRNGRIATDGGTSQDDPDLNAVVKEITGQDSLDALRQQYIQDLDSGAWTFNGFAGFADNSITEDLPGIPNPAYLTASAFNLCADAYVGDEPGEASAALAASNLVDGDRSTKWEAARSDVNGPDELGQGVQQDILIILDKSVTFDTYILYHEGSQGNSDENTRAWRITYYDDQKGEWILFDEVQDNTEDVTTRHVEPVTTKMIWLEILNPSGTGDGTVRLYELEMYRSEALN